MDKQPPYVPTDFWPTAEQLLLLQAAFLPVEEALAAWQRWRSQVDLEHAGLDHGSLRLLPLVSQNLYQHVTHEPLWARKRHLRRRTWYENQLRIRTSAQVIELLHQTAIDTLVLKGVPMLIHYD